MTIVEKLKKDLINENGIFFNKKNTDVSYPKEGNELYFEIEKDSFWFNHRNRVIIEAVQRYSPNEVFFDIGGGNGFVASGLENNGIPVVLIEPGIQGCLNAKKRGLSTIICSTLEDSTLESNTVPAVGLFDVIEHIENDSDFIQLIKGFLIENGLVYISVPAYQFLWSDEDTLAGHYRRYTLPKLEQLLKDCGFKIEFSSYFFNILPLPVFLFRTLPYKLGFKSTSVKKEKNLKEHQNKKGFLKFVLDFVWDFELKRIKKGKKMPVGGSCFIVARKVA